MGEQKNAPVQDINQLLKVRREKLAELQEAGKDPFTITKYDVTAKAASVKADYEVTEAKFKEEAGDDEEAFRQVFGILTEQNSSIRTLKIFGWRLNNF